MVHLEFPALAAQLADLEALSASFTATPFPGQGEITSSLGGLPMYLVDFHCHTSLSPDGNVHLSPLAQAMYTAGIREMCVTDHCDLLTEDGRPNPVYDWAPVLAQYEEGEFFADPGLIVRLGIELGSAPFAPQAARAILARPELDFVLGSLHNWSPSAGGADFYFTSYDSDQICADALEDYFTSMEALTGLPDCYDSLAHLIYPLRYMARDGHPISLLPYEERIRNILTAVARSGHALELNTYVGRTVSDWAPILTWYKECGGELITVGSDAHHTQTAGAGIPEAYELIRAAGFRYVTVYEKRKPRPLPLDG